MSSWSCTTSRSWAPSGSRSSCAGPSGPPRRAGGSTSWAAATPSGASWISRGCVRCCDPPDTVGGMTEAPRDDAAGLARAGEGVAEVAETTGTMRAAISNAMVGLKAKWYGKGPERARTYLADDDVFVVMEGGLTRNEQTLL